MLRHLLSRRRKRPLMRARFLSAVLLPALHLCVLVLRGLAFTACRRAGEPMAELAVAPAEFELQLGAFVELSLRIIPLADLEPGVVPQVFLHLIDEPGSVLRTFDHALPAGFLSGREIAYRVRVHQSAVADATSPSASPGRRCRPHTPAPRTPARVAALRRPRPGCREARVRCNDANEKDRRQCNRGSASRLNDAADRNPHG